MNIQEYYREFSNQIALVYKSHLKLRDHREHHPWLTGALGDPFAGVWFVAENPSLTMVERAYNPGGGSPTPEAQWYASRGDKLVREKLIKHDFKMGGVDSLGVWKCYITNVVKESDYAKDWREKTQALRNQAPEIWSSVFSWEVANSKPRLVVVMGKTTQRLLRHLERNESIRLPRTEFIQHYAYVAHRPRGKLGPMHPQGVQEYDNEIANIANILKQM